MGTQLPESYERPPAQVADNAQEVADRMRDEVFQNFDKLTKKEWYPPEITVSGKPGEQHRLPGNCVLDVLKDGSQRVGYTDPTIKTPGPHETVRVNPDGSISTSSITNGQFHIRRDGDKQIVTMPSGNSVTIENGRITETNTGGKKTETLTPAEAENREQQRQREREMQIQIELKKTAVNIADSINNGNVPVDQIRKSYEMARMGFYGKNGVERLTETLNAVLGRGQKAPVTVSAGEGKDGSLQVKVYNPRTNDLTYMNLAPVRTHKLEKNAQ